jgi:hypothetical protein
MSMVQVHTACFSGIDSKSCGKTCKS